MYKVTCMSSARCSQVRGVGRASGSFPTRTSHLLSINYPRAPGGRRWNSLQPSIHSARQRGGGATRQSRRVGWKTTSVVSLAVGTGLLAFGLATFNAKRREARQREYSNEAKFREPKYADVNNLKDAIKEIRHVLGDEDVISTDPEDLHAHGYSEWSSTNIESLPVAVAYPKNTKEVSEIAKVCCKYKVPIIPFSGGTSLEGNFSAPYGGVSVDFAYMDQIVQFHEEDMDIVVQPSVSWMDLNDELAKRKSGLFFPVDPGPSAKIGGMVGTNCSGTNAVRYGTMKDWVINLTVVLADGTIIKTKRRPRKTSAGYNLNSLFVGSEGTLGLVTEITLKLAVVPQEQSVAVVTFPSIRDAASAAAGVMRAGVQVAAMEIMDEVQMKVVNLSGSTAPRKWKELPTLFFKFSGTKASVKDNIQMVGAIAKKHKGGDFEFAKDAQEQKMLWSARKESLWSMLSMRKEGNEVWSTDVAVPFSRLADIIEISKKEMDDLGLFASILGHIGDGNFHESILYDSRVKGEKEKVERCVKNMVNRALEMEGTCTGEHGIGIGKKEALLQEVGPHTLGVMKSIKQALDPHWIMNPGKIMDLPSKS
ncbi:FAD-linked oxidase, C-terminal [Glarea lozoyensis ATCC 20868]|uniref:D-lactate dehydrogenase (cytochrome) n=1 Tax=Glarea lozoyensis (strain ATCC 20868 / MF5171) TaxID=1116229 RepID=S3DCC2_GLAL2|nr:FAD-linked oxidase, C-terminal [Glarea lozoyensis ATCC 20868]EPE24293.1 FAD-linked oxidase, C-terminal [Glarea lozoyensis ATCC 20868]